MKNTTKNAVLMAICFILLFALSSCGFDKKGCFESVQKEFPYGDVKTIHGEDWIFIIKQPDGSIWYAKTLSEYNTNVTEKVKIW